MNLTLRRGCSLIVILVLLVVGVPVTFPLRVRPARNYPLDLYLLMDLSYSMSDDLSNLKSLGNQIGNIFTQVFVTC